jgi:Tol biopolymer transport system component
MHKVHISPIPNIITWYYATINIVITAILRRRPPCEDEAGKMNMFKKRLLYGIAFFTLSISLSCALVNRTFSRLEIPNSGAPLGLIAYTGVDGNIYTINREGQEQSAITNDANASLEGGKELRIYQSPVWAPNGNSLAFIGLAGSSRANQKTTIYTTASNGKERVESFSSATDFPFYLFWSPDNKKLTFLSTDSGGAGLALHLVTAAGDSHQVVGTGQPLYWDWSPDGNLLFLHSGGSAAVNPGARIALFGLNGSGQKKELDLKPGFFQAPAWSPGGEEVVLAAEDDAGAGELVLASREGDLKRVLAQVKGPVAFAWAPDGGSLAYTTTSEGDSSGLFTHLILLNPAQAGEAKNIVNDVVLGYFWSPDSHKIAYFVPDLQRPNGVSLISRNAQKLGLQILVYDLDSDQTHPVAAFEPTDAFLQILPFFDQYQRSGTIWSPDSNELVLSLMENDGSPHIAVVAAKGGQLHSIADGDLAFWSWK